MPAVTNKYNIQLKGLLSREWARHIMAHEIIMDVCPENILSVHVNAVPPTTLKRNPNRAPALPVSSVSGGRHSSTSDEGRVVTTNVIPLKT